MKGWILIRLCAPRETIPHLQMMSSFRKKLFALLIWLSDCVILKHAAYSTYFKQIYTNVLRSKHFVDSTALKRKISWKNMGKNGKNLYVCMCLQHCVKRQHLSFQTDRKFSPRYLVAW